MTRTMTVDMHRAQHGFCHSDAIYRAMVGGRGSGKSWVGAYDTIRRAEPGCLYGVYGPTYGLLRDVSMRSFLDIGEKFDFIRDIYRGDMRVVLGNDAEVLFRSVDDPERARGPNLSGAWLDEASMMQRAAFDIIIASLREGGRQGWLSATFTPKGRSHWTYDVFGNGAQDVALFHARSIDNPFLADGFVETVRSKYTEVFAAQELGGEFIDLVGNIAQRHWFTIVDAVPAGVQRIRAWDFAATAKKTAGDDPDYTVGTLMTTSEGVYYVVDVIRQQIGPGEVERLVKQTAEVDGIDVQVILEQEPGSSGKIATGAMIRNLAGWNVRAEPSSGDKVTRAMPFLAQSEAGNIKLVRGYWNARWLDEMCAFPVGAHDDQVDSVSLAFNVISRKLGSWAW